MKVPGPISRTSCECVVASIFPCEKWSVTGEKEVKEEIEESMNCECCDIYVEGKKEI